MAYSISWTNNADVCFNARISSANLPLVLTSSFCTLTPTMFYRFWLFPEIRPSLPPFMSTTPITSSPSDFLPPTWSLISASLAASYHATGAAFLSIGVQSSRSRSIQLLAPTLVHKPSRASGSPSNPSSCCRLPTLQNIARSTNLNSPAPSFPSSHAFLKPIYFSLARLATHNGALRWHVFQNVLN